MFLKKLCALFLCFFVSLHICAKVKPLLFTFDSFLLEFVEKDHKQAFAQYYRNMVVSKQDHSKLERSKFFDPLAKEGRAALQIQAPGYFEQLTKTAGVKDQHTTFVRFGAYQDFQKQQIKATTRFVTKARSYFNGARTKMVSWFHSFRKPVQSEV